MIIRETTYEFSIPVEIEKDNINDILILFSQNEEIRLEKHVCRGRVHCNKIFIVLSAEETCSLKPDIICDIQPIFRLNNGVVKAGDIKQVDVSNSLLNYF